MALVRLPRMPPPLFLAMFGLPLALQLTIAPPPLTDALAPWAILQLFRQNLEPSLFYAKTLSQWILYGWKEGYSSILSVKKKCRNHPCFWQFLDISRTGQGHLFKSRCPKKNRKVLKLPESCLVNFYLRWAPPSRTQGQGHCGNGPLSLSISLWYRTAKVASVQGNYLQLASYFICQRGCAPWVPSPAHGVKVRLCCDQHIPTC